MLVFNIKRVFFFVLMTLILLCDNSYAQKIYFKSGTGFFVHSNFIVTNYHVVDSCKAIYVEGDRSLHSSFPLSRVTRAGYDKKQDLALLKTSTPYRKVSAIRQDSRIKKGDKVVVIGYPGDHGVSGRYKIVESKITNVQGNFGDETAIEFTDSVRQGNSGGPLFDLYGNVVGVIVGLKTYYSYNVFNPEDKRLEEQTGVAIPLAALKKFLVQYRVPFQMRYTYGTFSAAQIEQTAKKMIVSIKCIQ